MFYFINLCFQNLLKTATDCCWTERQIQWDAWGSVHTARVAQQCLHVNCLHMIQKKQWPSNSPHLNHSADIMSGSNARSFWKPHLKPNTVSESKIAEGKMEKFYAEQSCPERLTEYMKYTERHSKHLLILKKVFTLALLCLHIKLARLKAVQFCQFCI